MKHVTGTNKITNSIKIYHKTVAVELRRCAKLLLGEKDMAATETEIRWIQRSLLLIVRGRTYYKITRMWCCKYKK